MVLICQCLAFNYFLCCHFFFQLKGAIAAAEEDRGDLEDKLAEMKDKLREARARAEEAVSDRVAIIII